MFKIAFTNHNIIHMSYNKGNKTLYKFGHAMCIVTIKMVAIHIRFPKYTLYYDESVFFLHIPYFY